MDEDPNSKAAFNILRQSYSNADKMVEDFLHDHQLHLRCRILVHCGKPLQAEYGEALRAHSEGQAGMLQYQARRSNGMWYKSVVSLFHLLRKPDVLMSLELRQQHPDGEPQDPSSPDMQNDMKNSKTLWALVVELAMARCWSQLHHSFTLPHAFVRVSWGNNFWGILLAGFLNLKFWYLFRTVVVMLAVQ